jgi:predicted HTH transcriptional regulator
LQDIDLFRNDITQYDQKVIEEMIVNAVVHRDWDINLWIEVVQTPISLEIRNPGKFRANLDGVLLKNKRPEYLNPNLADFFKKIHLMEKEGGGLKKVYSTQIKKGLSIRLEFDNESANPRVDFLLSGKVKNIAFARFMFMSKDLTQNQVVILDKINSGKNKLEKDITVEEYLLVEKLVVKTGRGGSSLKIKEYLLKKSKNYIDDFSSTHASQGTSKDIILDYAKKNSEFTTSEIYNVLSGKSKVWIRKLLMDMTNNNELRRVSHGVYGLALLEQTKFK